MSDLTEKVLSSKRIYEGKIINLRVDNVLLPDGQVSKREVVEYTGAVAIVPVNKKGELLLVKQYRHAVGKVLLELPAGKFEPGEDPATSARRELLEETGYQAESLKKLVEFFSTPGFTTEELHIFLATGLTLKEQNLDEDEFIEVITIPFKRALEMIWSGEIRDAKSVTGIFAAHNLKERPAEVY